MQTKTRCFVQFTAILIFCLNTLRWLLVPSWFPTYIPWTPVQHRLSAPMAVTIGLGGLSGRPLAAVAVGYTRGHSWGAIWGLIGVGGSRGPYKGVERRTKKGTRYWPESTGLIWGFLLASQFPFIYWNCDPHKHYDLLSGVWIHVITFPCMWIDALVVFFHTARGKVLVKN